MPATTYARSGGTSIAYQVHGDGPVDLVFTPGFVSHIEWCWEEPSVARFLDRLASFTRLIIFDKRGTGLSDPVSSPPTLETRADDIRAVLDAVGTDRAALLGWSEGSAMNVMFAALHPERTERLVLYGSYARLTADGEYPGFAPEALDGLIAAMEQRWGRADALELWSPNAARDARLSAWWGTYLRLSASPGMAHTLLHWYPQIDVRSILDAVHVPTLMLHRRDDTTIPIEMGRALAGLLPAATFVEVPGDEHLFFLGDQDPILDEIQSFLTGERSGPRPDRYLTTILFVDIVSSTELASSLGDRRWSELLTSFYATARRQLDRFRGVAVVTTGDGLLATFDGPARAIAGALAIRDASRALELEVRAGVHAGEVEVVEDGIGGLAVHIAARVSALAGPGEVLVSSTVRELVAGGGIEFTARGTHPLKGVPGRWAVFAVRG
jgi:pimeloyl-ACP methyl ester carboxylesterase/class 3 adenylate cyclase